MITSTANARIKSLMLLSKKSKERKRQGLFIAEGLRVFTEIPKDLIVCVYVSESFYAQKEHRTYYDGLTYEIVSDNVYRHVSDTENPQGILCVARMLSYTIEKILDGDGIWLILETIQDPGNLGTIFRSAQGAGIRGIILDAHTADVYSPKVVRSTMGSLCRVPFLITGDLSEIIHRMQKKGIVVYAAQSDGSICYDRPDYKKPSAFLIGNEGNGLRAQTAAMADARVHIPMENGLESLNAAVAASILMFEGSRQRRS